MPVRLTVDTSFLGAEDHTGVTGGGLDWRALLPAGRDGIAGDVRELPPMGLAMAIHWPAHATLWTIMACFSAAAAWKSCSTSCTA